jgi:hypothetical protein
MNPQTPTDIASDAVTCDNFKNNYIELNTHCFCISLDHEALELAFRKEVGDDTVYQLVRERCPHLFAVHPVFIDKNRITEMQRLIQGIESIVALPSYRAHVLKNAPAIARHNTRHVQGVFFGYDFHANQEELGLIEINTNAGGAMLNAMLARAQRACCEAVQQALMSDTQVEHFEAEIIAMFQQEWQLSEKPSNLKRIAIVDENVSAQYLYPEFLLFQNLFKKHGIDAVICNPEELIFENGIVSYQEKEIDMIYNRLTDFYLEQTQHQHLHQAYLSDAIVMTPHPQAHALYADKSNLVIFSSHQELEALGVTSDVQHLLLKYVPHTELVRTEKADFLWKNRRQFFFKPCNGFGSRAAYRGDKLTTRVWQEILVGRYVAQTLIIPGERYLSNTATEEKMKFDLRAYTYAGKLQWLAARLYQGQTTNFRTHSGGFAPVYPV